MSEATFTFRVDEALKSEFAQAARAQDRTAAQLLRDYMREFVSHQKRMADYDSWFRREVEIGLADAKAGNFVSAAEVEAEAATWRDQLRRDLASRRS